MFYLPLGFLIYLFYFICELRTTKRTNQCSNIQTKQTNNNCQLQTLVITSFNHLNAGWWNELCISGLSEKHFTNILFMRHSLAPPTMPWKQRTKQQLKMKLYKTTKNARNWAKWTSSRTFTLKTLLLTTLHLFDHNYTKNSNILKNNYNLKEPFVIWIYFNL